ncbi:hypothetical protein FKO59_17805 [Burkholderia pseudomallei]|nr:hypothetical protein BOC36_20490 [Burkholderia pseudomallei]ARK78321.1 hypothetical protein BOC39_34605 [Burkholderia pseudomallei]ARK89643.1 hypothetical protein BOC42_21620 [Burkholderia pseudomallei]ARL09143.1 hypothetical protein BOC45_10125 [Burkholderia pseudomallei]ARL38011.1 hypothetical protein BOC49_18725 [Burkholderia pseudomallei]
MPPRYPDAGTIAHCNGETEKRRNEETRMADRVRRRNQPAEAARTRRSVQRSLRLSRNIGPGKIVCPLRAVTQAGRSPSGSGSRQCRDGG